MHIKSIKRAIIVAMAVLCLWVKAEFMSEFSKVDVENIRGRGKELFSMFSKIPPLTGPDVRDTGFVYTHKTNGVFGATNTTFRIEKYHPNDKVDEWTHGLIGIYLYFADGHNEMFDYERDGRLLMYSSNFPQQFNFKTYTFDVVSGALKSYFAITNGVPAYPSLTFENGKAITNKPMSFCVKPLKEDEKRLEKNSRLPDSYRGVLKPTDERVKWFWREYDKFKQQCKASKPRADAILFARFDDYPAYIELEKSETDVLPLIYQARIARLCHPMKLGTTSQVDRLSLMANDMMLEKLWPVITFQHTVKRGKGDFIWAGENLMTWWEGGDKFAAARAEFLLHEMRAAKQECRFMDEKRALVQLADMGMFSFPTLFPELEAGQGDVLVVFKLLSENSRFKPGDTREALLTWWGMNKKRYALPTQASNFKWPLALEKWKHIEQPRSR